MLLLSLYSSSAPRLAATKARLVIQAGTPRPEVRKSSLVETLRLTANPMPGTKTK